MPTTRSDIARLVVTWACGSRHDVRHLVATGGWTHLGSGEGLVDGVGLSFIDELSSQDRASLASGFGTFSPIQGQTALRNAAAVMNGDVDDFWSGPPCPKGQALNAAYDAMVGAYDLD